MIHLFHKISEGCSKEITKSYSTSFSLGILTFNNKYRQPIYNIYGFVRIADEIVDSFHHNEKEYIFKKFRKDTYEAIKLGISTNPVLHSFQKTVHKYGIEMELIDAFLNSMEKDLSESSHARESYDEYVTGSAEVVGLMCLKVFVERDQKIFDELKPYAQRLGAAFQKVNFLRDIKEDLEQRGRIYLPDVHEVENMNEFNKNTFEEEIEKDFKHSLKGIYKLPIGVRLGVYLAYTYYQSLFNRLRGKSIEQLKKKRVRIPNFMKLLLLIKSYFKIRLIGVEITN